MTENGNQARPVRTLTVKNFSVIKEAKLEFGKITVLIGPQASGKSLLCKLAHFLGSKIIDIGISHVTNRLSFPVFESTVKKEFLNWFPRGGWGGHHFVITFFSNDYEVTISGPAEAKLNSEIAVKFAGKIKQEYIDRLAGNASARYNDDIRPTSDLLSSLAQLSFRWMSGRGLSDNSIYIPLERSYFVDTKKGYKALASDADPISADFAALFANSLDRNFPSGRLAKFLNGSLGSGPEGWFFSFEDGRELPLSELSSGSKETLPILSVLDMFENRIRQPRWDASSSIQVNDKTYSYDDFTIEEPEASVFPRTQYELVKEFAKLANGESFKPHFTITTHSPYILSVFGDLVKAGKVGAESPEHRATVSKVIPEQYWINDGDFAAYKIEDKKLVSIYDKKTGQIDGDYLDSVSGKISDELGQLLEIQYGG